MGALQYLCPCISPLLYMSTASFLTWHKAKIIFALVTLPSSFPLCHHFLETKVIHPTFCTEYSAFCHPVLLFPHHLYSTLGHIQLPYCSTVYLSQRIWNTKRTAKCKFDHEAKTCRTKIPMLDQWCFS